jgi:peptide-methionine (S)-S-oxide reductase
MNNYTEIATIANGCFWCSEAIFKRLKGIKSVLPGYSGGIVKDPSYNQVCTGKTGHAESIQIEFDPKVTPFEKILDIFWHTHDPTTLNRQGNDVGTQYRSAIFYHNQKQKEIAERSKKELEKEGVYKDPIVTEITPFRNFYVAEDYHKNYYENNQNAPYCNFIIDPKVNKMVQKYGNNVKEEYIR